MDDQANNIIFILARLTGCACAQASGRLYLTQCLKKAASHRCSLTPERYVATVADRMGAEEVCSSQLHNFVLPLRNYMLQCIFSSISSVAQNIEILTSGCYCILNPNIYNASLAKKQVQWCSSSKNGARKHRKGQTACKTEHITAETISVVMRWTLAA